MDKILLSTAYFPPVSYFSAIAKAQVIEIEQCETFAKQTYRNRCVISSANGALPLSVPVKKHSNTLVSNIYIAYEENWQIKHWRAIESAYNASPFFMFYKDELHQLFFQKYEKLMELNNALLSFILKKLKIEKQIEYTQDFLPLTNQSFDLRNAFSPKKPIDPKEFKPYYQVFSDKYGFLPNLSILDLLFNEGPSAVKYL